MISIKSIPINKKIPAYGYPVSRNIISLDDSKMMATFCLRGMPFESESDNSLESAFITIKGYFHQLAKSYGQNLAIWTHIVKREDTLKNEYVFPNGFVQEFSNAYIDSFKNECFFKTEYFITFIIKMKGDLDNAINDFEDLLQMSQSVFKNFNPYLLKLNQDGSRCRNFEFLSYLLNFNHTNIPLTSNKVNNTICNSDWHFGYDVLEIRNNNNENSKYATFYELDGMPPTTERGMWDFILNQKCEFILTQSMILMKPINSLSVLDKQINLVSSSDNSKHEIQELENAKEYVSTGEVSFGDYHCSLTVFSNNQLKAIENGNDLKSEFLARGTILKRSNLKSIYSFLSSLPSSKERIKSSPRTTTNLACTWSLHNYSQGKDNGNPIGDGSALIPLKTVSDTLFYLNCHASEQNKNVTGQKYAGHTMILGASGTGKTTLEVTITAFLTRFNPQIFAIDYNRSIELFMRTLGAQYFTIREGIDTGLNPFQLEKTPELVSFLYRLVYILTANNNGVLNEDEEEELKNGIDTVMRLEVEKRCLSMLLQTITLKGLRSRLSKWCRSSKGQFSWCLDSPINKFNPDNMDQIGFDSTMLLEGKGHPASEPVLATLFFLKDLMQKKGRLMLTIVEEFWMPANFQLTQNIMKRVLKAGRLKNEFMILSSQSPEDAINCDIVSAIVQQTATKIFLPNPDAEFLSYEKCNVTQSEFDKFKKLSKTSRTFLVKQSNTSCFAKLDLHGFDDFLPIISGTEDDINQCEKIRIEYGESPEKWMPIFKNYLKGKK